MAIVLNNCFAQSIPNTAPRPPQDLGLNLPIAPIQAQAKDTDGMQFSEISISALSKILFSEVLQKNYILSSDLLSDSRMVSFRYNYKKDGNLEKFIVTFYKSQKLNLYAKDGIYFVEKIEENKDYNFYVYTPKYKNSAYLLDQATPFFAEYFTTERGVKGEKRTIDEYSPRDVSYNLSKDQELLTFKYSDEKTKNKILDFFRQIDIATPDYILKAQVYEVSYSDTDGSALGLMINLANKKFNIKLNSTSPLDNFVSFSNNALSLFASNINTDSRIKLKTSQVLRLKNRKEASWIVGQSVPTLGNISYQGASGTAVQSVNYQDTGLVIKVTPNIHQENIDIQFTQEMSEAISTLTGVNNSPTLTKRNFTTEFTTTLDEVVMLAGLTQEKKSNNVSRPFIFPFIKTTEDTNIKTDIVIFISVSKANKSYVMSEAEPIGKATSLEEEKGNRAN